MEEDMEHALIIGDDSEAVDILKESLRNAGYHSIAAARDAVEAWTVLRSLHPKVIVVAPDALSGGLTDQLYQMSEMTGAPIVVATADPAAASRCLGPTVSLDGPYPAYGITDAGGAALTSSLHLAHGRLGPLDPKLLIGTPATSRGV